MDDFKIKSPIFNAISILRLDDTLKTTISTNPSLLNPILELPVKFINWSPRVKHVFENRKLIKIRDLVNNLEELHKFRNFGAKSYNEVVAKLSKHFKRYFNSVKYKNEINRIADKLNGNMEHRSNYMNKGMLGAAINERINSFSRILCDEQKINKFLNSSIERINWSIRNINIFKNCGIKFVKDFSRFDVEQLLSFKNFGKKCLREVYDNLENFAVEIEKTPKSLGLENLVKYILSKLSVRHRDIMSRRYGLWEGKRETLEEISKSFGVTRERIRQIQKSQVKKIQRVYKNSTQLISSLEDLFIKKLRPFLEANKNIANSSELLKIIYDIDNEKIGADLANEFLSEVFFDEKPIFSGYVINFDKDVVGLFEKDQEFYLKLMQVTNACLKEKKTPQSIDELIVYFTNNKSVGEDREKIKRFLTVSNVAKDATGKFGLEKWEYFNSRSIHGMAERALIEINKPAHFTQIALLMNDLFPEYGIFDSHNVHARIGGRKDIFVWVAPGVFGLKRWGLERPPYVKDYLIKLLKKTNKPMHINELTEKVLEKCNCSKSSVFLTLCMNEDTFIKYPEKFYGLICWK
jgi:DNA-directed RNA polymerase alpha subunit